MGANKILTHTVIKNKINTLIKNKIRPAVGMSKTGKLNDQVTLYNSSYRYIEWMNQQFLDEHVNCIYNSLVECAWDYPEKYIHLLGYSINNENGNEYVIDNIVVYIPPAGEPRAP
jgi:hypothetical protein